MSFSAVAALLMLVEALAIAGASPTYRINDGMRAAAFVVAMDELHIERRVIPIQPQSSIGGLQSFARALEVLKGSNVDLVLYPARSMRDESSRRYLTREVLVQLDRGRDIHQLAAEANSTVSGRPLHLAAFWLLAARAPAGSLALAERLRTMPGVISAEPQLARRHAKKLIPNDTYFSTEWHLRNTGQGGGTAGIDVNVINVWNTWRGSNILVGIVDDGLDVAHVDLAPAVDPASWDFNGNDPDPSPHLGVSCDDPLDPTDCHGTAVAGVAAARGNNTVGVTGAAFEARLAGLRLLGAETTDSQDAAAMAHSNAIIQIKNNSWGAPDCGGSTVLDGGGPLMRAAIRDGVQNGRGGRGVVYVWAGGNGNGCGEDVNYDGYANDVNVIAIGAVTSKALAASYSEPGACLVAVAPSSGGGQSITTTDISGDAGYNYVGSGDLSNPSYTATFGGTSSAAPLASGVIALLLQANPSLGHRDVKEILLRSGTRVQPGDAGWATNTAGVPHHLSFGGGMVNALAAITLATNWFLLGAQSTLTLMETNLGLAIPDNAPAGVTRTFTFSNQNFRVENVTVTVTAPHSRWGDLAVTLTAPSGTISRLASTHAGAAGYNYDAWPLHTVRHWGEHAAGTWTVTVSDGAFGNTGTLEAIDVTLYGSTPSVSLSITNSGSNLTLAAAAVGWKYAIDAAPALTGLTNDWQEVGSIVIPVSGRASFTDTNSSTAPYRFYRARLKP